MTRTVRKMLHENQLSPKKAALQLQLAEEEPLRGHADTLRALCRVQELELLPPQEQAPAAQEPLGAARWASSNVALRGGGQCRLAMQLPVSAAAPASGGKGKASRRQRKLRTEAEKLAAQLANSNFREKAPEAVLQQATKRLQQLRKQLEALEN